MAGSGYAYRGYSTYSGVPPRSDEWSKTNYASDTDHLYQPVFDDAAGRKLPVILVTPNYVAQSYVTKVETIVEYEYVHTPLVIGYRHCYPPMDEPEKDYGYKFEPWKDYGYKNSFPTKAEPMKESGYKVEPMKDYKYKTEPVKGYGYKPEPMKDYGSKAEPIKDYGYKTQPIRDYGYKAEPKKEYGKVEPMNDYKYANDKSSPVHDHPQEVEDYTETRPSKRFQEQDNNYSLKASSYVPKEPSSDCSVKQPENVPRLEINAMEPTMINTGGWVRPNRATWSTPTPSHQDATLSKSSTSDPGTAVENLKEASKPLSVSGPTPRFSVPPPKRDANTETIDSREAARRYCNITYRPQATEEKYTKTIDSREAVRKYGGVFID